MPPDNNNNNNVTRADINELKEFMYRSSEQLKYLSEQVKTTNSKVEGISIDVLRIKSELETHPLLCPLNPEKIQEVVKTELRTGLEQEKRVKEVIKEVLAKRPEQRLNKTVKWATVINTILVLVALIISLYR